MVKRLKEMIESTDVGKRVIRDGRFRTVLAACWALLIDIVYAVFNGALGVSEYSFWFITLCAYYTALAFMRFYAVTYELGERGRRTERAVMRFCGFGLCVLAIVLSGVVCLTIATGRGGSRHMAVMIAIAAYTFWKAVIAVINAVRARRTRSRLLITLRNINIADAAASMLSLEHSMMATFSGGAEDMQIMDGATGAGVFLTVLLLGVGMLVQSGKDK